MKVRYTAGDRIARTLRCKMDVLKRREADRTVRETVKMETVRKRGQRTGSGRTP